MKKLNIMVDIDNTVCDTAKAMLDIINNKYGTHFVADDINQWKCVLKNPNDGTLISYTKELFIAYDTPGFLTSIPPISGAQGGIKRLRDSGHNITMLTGRSPKYAEDTKVWMDTFIARDIPIIHATEKKFKYMDGFDLIFDDAPDEVISIYQNGGKAVLMKQPWNWMVPFHHAKRVNDWAEFLQLIRFENF